MYCRACGEQLETSDTFCPVCGTTVTPLKGPIAKEPQQGTIPPAEARESAKADKDADALMVGSLVLLGSAIVTAIGIKVLFPDLMVGWALIIGAAIGAVLAAAIVNRWFR